MACVFYKKDWLNKNGTLNDSIKTKYDEIPGVSKNISKCLSSKPLTKGGKRGKRIEKKVSNLKIGLELLPSIELMEQLRCASFMINNGLDSCLEVNEKSKNKVR